MTNRIKEAFMLDEIEIELKRSGDDFDNPEKVIRKYTQSTPISEMRELPVMFRDNSFIGSY